MSQTKTTKRAMMTSKRWLVAVKDLSVEEMAAKGPMDLDAWDDATHESVRAWARGETGGTPPGVIAVYLGQFEPMKDPEEVWGDETDRPLAAARESRAVDPKVVDKA